MSRIVDLKKNGDEFLLNAEAEIEREEFELKVGTHNNNYGLVTVDYSRSFVHEFEWRNDDTVTDKSKNR